ncbi:MAG: hypothetical protein IPP22_03890 [Nitrosomonas sp.]|nr:hypothetical protein [Nitrosomonas sp.]
MMKKEDMARFLVVGVLMISSHCIPAALADKWICTEEEARSAEVIVATIGSWAELYQQFERYAHCDDGAIAEGFSESISLLLAEQWTDIPQVSAILIPNPTFQRFIIEHIDETVPVKRLERVGKNVRERCLSGLEDFCHKIEIEVIQVLPHSE